MGSLDTGAAGAPRPIDVTERPEIPWDGLLFGFGAMLPLVAAALLAWWTGPETAGLFSALAVVWGASLLIFLAGVRRGLSFRTPGGPRAAQIGMMLWLFCAGLGALALPPVLGLVVVIAGFASLLVADPAAARRGEAPLYFARLRPPQMALGVGSLLAILARLLVA